MTIPLFIMYTSGGADQGAARPGKQSSGVHSHGTRQPIPSPRRGAPHIGVAASSAVTRRRSSSSRVSSAGGPADHVRRDHLMFAVRSVAAHGGASVDGGTFGTSYFILRRRPISLPVIRIKTKKGDRLRPRATPHWTGRTHVVDWRTPSGMAVVGKESFHGGPIRRRGGPGLRRGDPGSRP